MLVSVNGFRAPAITASAKLADVSQLAVAHSQQNSGKAFFSPMTL
jgi:hypothetical protein